MTKWSPERNSGEPLPWFPSPHAHTPSPGRIVGTTPLAPSVASVRVRGARTR